MTTSTTLLLPVLMHITLIAGVILIWFMCDKNLPRSTRWVCAGIFLVCVFTYGLGLLIATWNIPIQPPWPE